MDAEKKLSIIWCIVAIVVGGLAYALAFTLGSMILSTLLSKGYFYNAGLSGLLAFIVIAIGCWWNYVDPDDGLCMSGLDCAKTIGYAAMTGLFLVVISSTDFFENIRLFDYLFLLIEV